LLIQAFWLSGVPLNKAAQLHGPGVPGDAPEERSRREADKVQSLTEAERREDIPVLLKGLLAALITLAVSTTAAWAAQEAICSQTAVFFCDNFEDRAVGGAGLQQSVGTKTGSWDLSDFSGIRVSTNAAFDGTKSMVFDMQACSWSNNQAGGCGVGYGYAQPGIGNRTEFYARHYVYWSPGYVWSPVADKHVAYEDSAGARAPWAWHTTSGNRIPHHIYEPTQTSYNENVGGSTIAWQTGRWYCIETRLKAGNGNAILEAWIDDVQVWRYTNATFPNAWRNFMVSGYWNTSSSGGSRGAQQRYFDNIVLSTQRIGCLGSQPPPVTAVPPSPPTALTVR
jgi:hypothetical protein